MTQDGPGRRPHRPPAAGTRAPRRAGWAVAVALAVVVGWAGAAGAQPAPPPGPGYVPVVIPQCRVYQTVGGGEVCGYTTIEEWQAAAAADAELVGLRARVPLLADRAAAMERAATAQEDRAAAEARARAVVEQRAAELRADRIKCDRDLQLERVKPRWGVRITWGVSAFAAGALAGFVASKM